MTPLKLITSIAFLLFISQALSQAGTYNRVKMIKETPKEATKNFVISEGVFEYPIIIGRKLSVVKLKKSKRVKIVYDKGEETEQVFKGNWRIVNGTVQLTFEKASENRTFQPVTYESGTYLESYNGRTHFKKQ